MASNWKQLLHGLDAIAPACAEADEADATALATFGRFESELISWSASRIK
jgi:heme oxygenase